MTSRRYPWLAFAWALALAGCGAKIPDADDWQRGPNADGAVVEIPLPDEYADGVAGMPVSGRPLYSIEQRMLFFHVSNGSKQFVYRYDIAARQGSWQERLPQPSTERRRLLLSHELFGSSRSLRDSTPAPVTQPFGSARLQLVQDETTYSRTRYNLGFPFGQSGWTTERYGDGTIGVYMDTVDSPDPLLMSQRYHADNYPFLAGWTPDGRFVVVAELLEDVTYYRGLKGLHPALRFAVFGPFEVKTAEPQIIEALARADAEARGREWDRWLRRGEIRPEQRYGAFYKELVATLRSCRQLLAIIGPIESLALDSPQTLKLSDGIGADDGLYFTFDLRASRGTGVLRAAAFYLQTPPSVRAQISSQIINYDLEFGGERHALESCGVR